jgi:hypothetical protein
MLLATCDHTARGRRDRALLLFGFAGALRRPELASLRVEDVVVDANGLRLRILRGKANQEGQGAEIGLPRGRQRRNLSAARVRGLAGGGAAESGSANFEKSARAGGSAAPLCIRTPFGGFWSVASAWPG